MISFLGSFGEKLLSPEGIIWAIGKASLVVAAFFAASVGEVYRVAALEDFSANNSKLTNLNEESEIDAPFSSYQVILNRNIFGKVAIDDTPATPPPKKAKPMSLRLVGTHIQSDSDAYAIIEDKKKNEQDIFEINNSVFEQGKLVEIAKSQVKIEHNGKLEVLEIEDSGSGGSGEIESTNEDGTDFVVPESELNDALANLPRLLSQARAVPYFRNGKSIGMRLFAIRRGSLYEKLGLKNGDIITTINENPLNNPAEALKLFEKLKSERSIKLDVERTGKKTQLNYAIE